MIELFRAKIGDALWRQLHDALEVGGGTHSAQDIIDGCLSGAMQLHQGDRSLCVSEIQEHPQARALHVFLAAGDMEELFSTMLDRVADFALFHGCDRLTLVGRLGWARAAKRIGFDSTHIAMTKMLAPVGANNKEDADDVR